jgi:hypothetical protein
VAWRAFLDAATEMAQHGTFSALARAIPGKELNDRFPSS